MKEKDTSKKKNSKTNGTQLVQRDDRCLASELFSRLRASLRPFTLRYLIFCFYSDSYWLPWLTNSGQKFMSKLSYVTEKNWSCEGEKKVSKSEKLQCSQAAHCPTFLHWSQRDCPPTSPPWNRLPEHTGAHWPTPWNPSQKLTEKGGREEMLTLHTSCTWYKSSVPALLYPQQTQPSTHTHTPLMCAVCLVMRCHLLIVPCEYDFDILFF